MKTILIADDSASARRVLEKILNSAGYSVVTAANGREALKLAFDSHFDAIVSDEDMPELNGSELFKILKTDPEKQRIPRILISGLTAEDDKPASPVADAFIPKGPDLRSTLLEILSGLT